MTSAQRWQVIGCALVTIVLTAVTFYICRDGFTKWALLTGAIALGGIGGIIDPPLRCRFATDFDRFRGMADLLRNGLQNLLIFVLDFSPAVGKAERTAKGKRSLPRGG